MLLQLKKTKNQNFYGRFRTQKIETKFILQLTLKKWKINNNSNNECGFESSLYLQLSLSLKLKLLKKLQQKFLVIFFNSRQKPVKLLQYDQRQFYKLFFILKLKQGLIVDFKKRSLNIWAINSKKHLLVF